MILSNSAIDKYIQCAKLYYYHYILRIREEQIGSPLFFGSALDSAFNELLKTKVKDFEGEIRDPKVVFVENMFKVEYNNEILELPFTLKTRYSFGDFDAELITGDYYKELQEYLVTEGYEKTNPIEIMENLVKYIKAHGYVVLDETDKIFYNYASWCSLVAKGVLIIEAYERDLLPKIKEVKGIQVEVTLPNEEGDHITGWEDFKAILFEPEGKLVVCDNKTSSKKYSDNSVKESQQLCIYTEFEEVEDAAYFVVNKNIRKTDHKTCLTCGELTTGREKTCSKGKPRCNGEFSVETKLSIDTQLIVDKITDEFKDETFDKIGQVLENIKNEQFDKNDKSKCFHFGRKCGYYNKCWGNDPDTMEGLVQLQEKENEKK